MTELLYTAPRFRTSGDAALTIEVGDGIDADVNARVVDLDHALTERALPGIVEIVPTYRTLLVCFDPMVLSRRDVETEVMALWPPAAGLIQHAFFGQEQGLFQPAQGHGVQPSANPVACLQHQHVAAPVG